MPQAPGPSRRIKELPVAISEHAYFLMTTWLGVGFDLLTLSTSGTTSSCG